MSILKKPGQPDPEQIVVLRALQLGDLLNAVPAFRALRVAFPSTRISLVGLPWSKEFVSRFHSYLDDHIDFPGFPGFPEQPARISELPSFLERMQKMEIDLAIQMQGSGELSNTLISLWGAKQTAGFFLPGYYCPDKNSFLEYPQNEPEAWRHLRLMEFLGIPLQGDELEFPLFEQDWEALEQIKGKYDLQGRYVCIHPGARAAFRRWPAENFASVADGLAAKGFQIVLTGTGEEAALTGAVAQKMATPAIDLAGETDLGLLAALVSQADMVLSNDTGMAHVAAALKTPSVILFAISESVRWAPLNRQIHKPLWRSMGTKAKEVLAQVESHLNEIDGRALEQGAERRPYAFGFANTGGRS